MTRIVGFGRLAAGAVVVVATVLAAGCSGGSDAVQSPTAEPTATPGPSNIPTTGLAATPTATAFPTFDGVTPIVLRAGESVPFPDGLVLYAGDAAWEGPSRALRRCYRDPSGAIRVDDLLLSAYGASDDETRAIIGATLGSGTADIAAALCHGTCYSDWQPVSVAHSSDGGISWNEAATFDVPGWVSVLAVDGHRVWVRERTWQRDYPWAKPTDRVFPLDSPSSSVTFPTGAANDPFPLAAALPGGVLLGAVGDDRRSIWRLDGTGEVLVEIPLPERRDVLLEGHQLLDGQGTPELQVQWSLATGDPDQRTPFLGVLDIGTGRFRTVLQTSDGVSLASVGVTTWLNPTLAIGSAWFIGRDYRGGELPEGTELGGTAIIDLEAGTVSPISELIDRMTVKAGYPVPIAAVVGNFARVVNAGTCLNVREAPAADAPVLACYADRVLLPVRTGAETAGGTTWVAVSTLDGRDGWAPRDSLELAGP